MLPYRYALESSTPCESNGHLYTGIRPLRCLALSLSQHLMIIFALALNLSPLLMTFSLQTKIMGNRSLSVLGALVLLVLYSLYYNVKQITSLTNRLSKDVSLHPRHGELKISDESYGNNYQKSRSTTSASKLVK